MRILGVALVLVLASGAAASCEQAVDPQFLDASPDAFIPHCKTSKDCPSGQSCGYPTFVGCGATGDCRDFSSEAGEGECTEATTACGCDGKLVQIPVCWMGFAPVPVLPNGQTACSD